jgi:hypothetical protein
MQRRPSYALIVSSQLLRSSKEHQRLLLQKVNVVIGPMVLPERGQREEKKVQTLKSRNVGIGQVHLASSARMKYALATS